MAIGLGGNLWRNKDFTRFWLAQSVSVFGSQFSAFAIPVMAVLTFNASPLDIGIINALAIAPYTILGLFVGVLVDRLRKRRIMIICNLGRMVTLATVPVGYVLHTLSLTQLFATSLFVGLFSVFFDISYQSYLTTLVERKDLMEGNQKLQLSLSGAQVAGPGLAGIIYQAIGGAFTALGDAIGYLSSALVLLSMKKEEPQPKRQGMSEKRFLQEMREGLDVVFKNRYLRSTTGSTAMNNLGLNIVGAVSRIFALRSLHFTTSELGLVGSIGAIGFVVGVLFVNRFNASLGLGRSLALTVTVPGVLALSPLALLGYPFIVLSVISFVTGLSTPSYNVTQVSLRQAITPDRLQGRMNASMRTVITSNAFAGALIGGLLGNQFGVVDTLYVGGTIAGLAGAWIVFGPVFRLRKNPEPSIT